MSFDIAIDYLKDLAPLADLRLDVAEVLPHLTTDPYEKERRERAIGVINKKVAEVKSGACNDIVEALGGVGVRPLEPCYVDSLASALFVYSHDPYAPTFNQVDAKAFQTAKLVKTNLQLERTLRLAETICAQGMSAEAGRPEFAWIDRSLLEVAGRPQIEISRPWKSQEHRFRLQPNTRTIHVYEYDDEVAWLQPSERAVASLGEPSMIYGGYRDATAEQIKKSKQAFALLRSEEPIPPTTLVKAVTYLRLNEPIADAPRNVVVSMGMGRKAYMEGGLSAYARQVGVELTFTYQR